MSLDELMSSQAGVVSRRQVLASGHDDNHIEKQLRKRHWSRVHPGVYVGHTGRLSWEQRSWAAVLFYGDAALCGASATAAWGQREPSARETIHVAVDQSRRVGSLPGVRVHRLTGFAAHVHPTRRPPIVRLELAVLQCASKARTERSAVAALSDACQSRRTTAGRLAERLRSMSRLPRRAFLLELLEDVATGTFSVLEHRYLTKVERPHGLPTAQRQRRVAPGRRPAYRDVEYLGGALVVELDGRLGHDETEDRWADLDRDIDSVEAGATTVRLAWGQVLDPCRAASAVGRLLRAVGWRGTVKPCGPACSGMPRRAAA
ncbi:MAG TPA: hypothetical protein VFG72_15105 [Marmoricola sp.]|nr:hypothetical protein [Marmoricola sp.]